MLAEVLPGVAASLDTLHARADHFYRSGASDADACGGSQRFMCVRVCVADSTAPGETARLSCRATVALCSGINANPLAMPVLERFPRVKLLQHALTGDARCAYVYECTGSSHRPTQRAEGEEGLFTSREVLTY